MWNLNYILHLVENSANNYNQLVQACDWPPTVNADVGGLQVHLEAVETRFDVVD